MKKYIFLMVVALQAVATLVSCNNDDPDPVKPVEGYIFIRPVLDWDENQAYVDTHMTIDNDYTKMASTDTHVTYQHKDSKATITYSFENNKLKSAAVTYTGCNNKFQTMLSDWQKNLGVAFAKVFNNYEATSAAYNCNLYASKTVENGKETMTMLIASNHKDDPTPDFSKAIYMFIEPTLKWDSSMAEVEAFIEEQGGYQKQAKASFDNTIHYLHNASQAEMTYTFANGKLNSCQICYWNSNAQFDKMREDWAKKLNLTWKQNEEIEKMLPGIKYYEANSTEKQCKVTTQQAKNNNTEIMLIAFIHE